MPSPINDILALLLVALFALLLIFGWALYIVRLGRPVDVSLKGFGIHFRLTSETTRKETHETAE